jgi:hypothetical protein
MGLFLTDPKTSQKSVSLTLMAISFLVAIAAVILNIAKVTDNVSSSAELFYGCAALYFGRKLNIKGNVFSSSDGPQTVIATQTNTVQTIDQQNG